MRRDQSASACRCCRSSAGTIATSCGRRARSPTGRMTDVRSYTSAQRRPPVNPLHERGYASIRLDALHGAGRRTRGPLVRVRQDRVRPARMSATQPLHLSHLDALESEAIHILREVAAELERPVLLFSGGKDSIVLLRLAEKAFRPGRFPFPLMHVDTGHNFPEVIDFRDRRVAELAERLVVASVQESIDRGRVVEQAGPRSSRNQLQTMTLSTRWRSTASTPLSAARAATRNASRAKERISLPRRLRSMGSAGAATGAVGPLQRRDSQGEQVRVFPISNWTELDVWQYVAPRAAGAAVDLLRARARGVRARRHALRRLRRASSASTRGSVHASGCGSARWATCRCTGAVRSRATTFDEVVRRSPPRGSPSAARRARMTAPRRRRWRTGSVSDTSEPIRFARLP